MPQFLKLLFAIIISFSICSCNSESNSPEIKVKLSGTSDFSISNWKLIGPFYTDSINSDTILNYNNLHTFGLNEADLKINDLENLQVLNNDGLFYLPEKYIHSYQNIPGMIDLENIVNTNKAGVIYAVCNIKSRKNQQIVLLAGGDESAKIYVNGKLYHSNVQNPYRLIYQNYIFAELKKGNNIILLKFSNTTKTWLREDQKEPWRYILNICSPTRYNNYHLKLEKQLIKNPVVPFQHPLEFAAKIHPVNPVSSIEIKNANGKSVLTDHFRDSISLNSLPIGLYNLNVYTKVDTFTQDFFYGDIIHGIKEMKTLASRIIKNQENEKLKLNIKALTGRFDTLINYYKKADYLAISEGKELNSYNIIDSIIFKPGRTIKLNQPSYVKLSTVNITNCLISEIEFYKQENESFRKIVYKQSNNEKSLLDSNLTNENIIFQDFNPWNPNQLFFSFKKDEKPDYMVLTNNINKSHYIQYIRLPTYYLHNFREIERRFIFLYKELSEILNHVKKGTEPFKNIPGTHVRAFVSNVEEQEQYYLVQSPNSILKDSQPKPLVVVLPWIYNAHYPFLRSAIIADIHIHEMYEWQVNLRDFIVVHVNARTFEKVVTEPISINNILKTIEAVKFDYNIDTTRIHLFSYCGGTEIASILATKYPSKFASLGIVGGFVESSGNKWMKNNYSINFTENLLNIPISIIHGEYDSHTPIASIDNFVKVAKSNGITDIELKVEPELTFEAYPRLRHHEEIFSFFSKNAVSMPKNINFSTTQHKYNTAYWLNLFPKNSGVKANVTAQLENNTLKATVTNAKYLVLTTKLAPFNKNEKLTIEINNTIQEYKPPFPKKLTIWKMDTYNVDSFQKNKFTEGPLINLFDEKFILVKSTIGNLKDNSSAESLLNNFIDNWERYYYVSPIVKEDVNISIQDCLESNLILFGNQSSNSVFKEIYPDLPIKILRNEIKIDDKTYKGKNLGYCITFPNPLSNKKYIVLLGGNNLSKVKLRSGIPSLNGFYDYEVYSYTNEKQYLLDNGNFNEFWKINN